MGNDRKSERLQVSDNFVRFRPKQAVPQGSASCALHCLVQQVGISGKQLVSQVLRTAVSDVHPGPPHSHIMEPVKHDRH